MHATSSCDDVYMHIVQYVCIYIYVSAYNLFIVSSALIFIIYPQAAL